MPRFDRRDTIKPPPIWDMPHEDDVCDCGCQQADCTCDLACEGDWMESEE